MEEELVVRMLQLLTTSTLRMMTNEQETRMRTRSLEAMIFPHDDGRIEDV